MTASEIPMVRYAAVAPREGWELAEETVPESVLHEEVVSILQALLVGWAARPGAFVARNLAFRWDESNPAIGLDPDLSIFDATPADVRELSSIRSWVSGQVAPSLAIEVVSETNARKDYVLAPDKYAASGTRELVIFDPKLFGPAVRGGPFRLQIWRRDADGGFTRAYAGEGPARSVVLDAWLVTIDGGRVLRIANDRANQDPWRSPEESERVAKEAERVAKEAERAAKESERIAKEAERDAKEAALARVAELEAALRKRDEPGG